MRADNTPRELLQALDYIRSERGPRPESLSMLESTNVKRIRGAFEDPNIVAIGISEKETEKKSTGELSLCFYVEKKIARSKVKPGHMIPPVMSVAARSAVFTDVQVIGRLRPQINRRSMPLQSGYSVGRSPETGTLGAIVKRGKKFYILSNSHVLADSGKGKVGDKIVYPGDIDRGSAKPQGVAVLSDFIAFNRSADFVNRVDAALAEINEELLDKIDFAIMKAKTPLAVIAPVRGMRIVKRGRTSGDTEGTIKDIHFSVILKYDGLGNIGFIDQVLCTRYSKPGDSGAITVEKGTGSIVGLHFAGSDQGSVFSPISNVTKALKIRFVSKLDR